jgi:methionyl-tRNA synthetase
LITTPIFYVNGRPHVGHAYTVVLSDFFARAYRLAGTNVRFITGTDEHGFKVARAAAAANVSPIEFCDDVSATFRDMNRRLEVSNDDFVRTTQERHRRVVHALWRRVARRGAVKSGSYSGWYSVADEQFVLDDDVVDGQDPNGGGACRVSRETGQPVERIDEPTLLLQLEAMRAPLLAWLARNASIVPIERHNELLAMVERGPLPDLSMSRPAARVAWGLPVPEQPSHTIYVWIDALANYLTASSADVDATVAALDDDSRQPPNWPPRLHVLGKDIIRFHGIHWIALLSAAGLELPRQLLVHAHWTHNARKLSKSVLSSTAGLMALDSHLGSCDSVDSLRFFLLKHGG